MNDPHADDNPDPPRTPSGRSIVDFLTDGSLVHLTESLSRVLGVPVELRDADGRVIRSAQSNHPWSVDTRAREPAAFAEPICADGHEIGWLALPDPVPSDDARRVVSWVARVASEFCSVELGLRRRVREVDVMYRLSALLIGAANPDTVLRTALELVLDAMELDAGSVVLLSEQTLSAIEGDERTITTKASRGLSEDWLESAQPLSRDRMFDRQAIQGEVIAIEDLPGDPRVLDPARVRREGLVSFICTGLAFRGRPIGVFRLYARSPRRFTDHDRDLLRAVAEHAAIAIEQARLLEIQEAEAGVRRQLQLAQDVQQRMLPATTPRVDRLDLSARYEPADRLAGDFYDLFLSRGRLALVVGDVVGHGIAAALMMASVRATLRAIIDDEPTLAGLMGKVNRSMCRDTLQSEFCTLFSATIDPETLELRHCGAGHDPPVLLRASGAIERLQPGGMLAGVMPDARYEESCLCLETGDVLIAFTDGLADVMNFSGERFGVNRLVDAARWALQQPGASSASIVERVFWELRQFAGLRSRSDDITVVVARVRE